MGLTMAEMALRLGERTAPQTVSRWESEAQPVGGYAEKVYRLVVCETLTKDAPGVEYSAAKLAALIVPDQWHEHEEPTVPCATG